LFQDILLSMHNTCLLEPVDDILETDPGRAGKHANIVWHAAALGCDKVTQAGVCLIVVLLRLTGGE